MADSAILAAGGGNAPLHYKVPGAAVIRIKQVHVAYADNGASGDWLPMVRIVSDSNHTMGQASDQGVKVTAGGDASVTFHPGVKHASSSGGDLNDVLVTSSGMWLDVANLGDTPYTVTAGSSDTITFPNGIFDTAAFTGSGGTDPLTLVLDAAFHASGLHNAQYALSLSVLWEDANFPRAAKLDIPLNQTVTVQGPQYYDFHAYSPASSFTTSNPTGLAPLWCRDTAWVLPKTANIQVRARVINGDVVDRDVIAAYMMGYCFYYSSFS